MRLRSTKDAPFCWQSKTALRRIREIAGESDEPSAASVLAVYTGLCEMASDKHSEVFEAARGLLASMSCVHVRTFDAALKVLTSAGLLHIERRKIDPATNLPSIYSLITWGGEIKCLPSEIKPHLVQLRENLTTAYSLKNQKECNEESKEEWGGLPPELEIDSFKKAWLAYSQYRRELKLRPLRPATVTAQWKKMASWGHAAALEAIEETIRQGWQGIFEPKLKTAAIVKKPLFR